jgi:hypothetical protein
MEEVVVQESESGWDESGGVSYIYMYLIQDSCSIPAVNNTGFLISVPSVSPALRT